jgi:class 3 adenylate cyclase
VHVAPAQSPADAETLEGERKTVTALFADIKGSTELIRDLDPEEARALVDPVLRLMMGAVHRYEGYVTQSTGDGIFALFGAPVAHEDHPRRALHAALAMQQAIREHAAKHVAQAHPAIATRVGVSTGEVVVRTVETGGHGEYTPIGLTAHLAARLQTVAAPRVGCREPDRTATVRGLLQLPWPRPHSGQGHRRAGRSLRSDRDWAAAHTF